jgi:hypothetical protein
MAGVCECVPTCVRTKQRCQCFTLLIVILTVGSWLTELSRSSSARYHSFYCTSLRILKSEMLSHFMLLHHKDCALFLHYTRAAGSSFCASQMFLLYLLQTYQTPILQNERNLNDFYSPNIRQYLMSGSGSPFRNLMHGE